MFSPLSNIYLNKANEICRVLGNLCVLVLRNVPSRTISSLLYTYRLYWNVEAGPRTPIHCYSSLTDNYQNLTIPSNLVAKEDRQTKSNVTIHFYFLAALFNTLTIRAGSHFHFLHSSIKQSDRGKSYANSTNIYFYSGFGC